MIDYKQKALDIYYASDVVNKKTTVGCKLSVSLHHCRIVDIIGDHYFVCVENSITDSRTNARISQQKEIQEFEHLDAFKVIGHPPTLASWLRLIGDNIWRIEHGMQELSVWCTGGDELKQVTFDLKTGEPTDWKALYKVIS